MRQMTEAPTKKEPRTSAELNAVITGASSGIGRAIATAIASTGAAVCLVGRNSERLESVARKMRATSRSVLICESDLSVDSAIEELALRLRQEFKVVDVLVHCAGTYETGKLASTPVQRLDGLYKMNVRMPVALTQALLPLLRTRSGQIVFINSSRGLEARSTTGLYSGFYSSTQHALRALADSLRQEVNADGIRVLSVYPGRTATPRMKALYELEGWTYQPELLLQAEDIAEVVVSSLLLPRTAEVTNIEIRPLAKSY
jgi:NADP-dependent 3-hydroxy acid dehydrogenase YdfG